jgi:hypothetical protein
MTIRCLLPLALLAASLWARPVYVDNRAGDDARDGASPETAVRSLKRGVELCEPGSTLHLAPGQVYTESLALGSKGGTASAPLVVEGNGAVLSGLRPLPTAEWQDQGEGLYFLPNRVQVVAARPFLVLGGGMVPLRRSVAEMKAEESCWAAEGVHFRAAPGKTIADYELAGTMLTSGLVLTGGSYIEVRNLVCEHFANDGFNVHGSCQGLVFRNIVSRWNGDDGFSIHEDVGATVYGGHFHHNNYGIQDINISRSSFYGVLIEDNRVVGADFMGGYHVLVDSVARNNAGPQIQAYPDTTRHMREPVNPIADGLLVLKNVLTVGGQQGLNLRGGRADVSGCTFAGAAEGVRIAEPCVAEMRESAVYGCARAELVCLSPHARFEANAYIPGRVQWQDRSFTPEEFAGYREASGQDTASVVEPVPVFARRGSFRLHGPDVVLGNRQLRPGLPVDPVFPFGEPVRNELASADPPRVTVLTFDFETDNPWSRVFPSPEENKDGVKVAGTAELSTERSHSGSRAMKLEVNFPPGRPGSWLVKLFSVKMPLERPVVEMRFWLFGDGSGLVFQPRLRDRSGECFYGPRGTLDWEGWREVVWDLRETPPVQIHSGDGNRQQDMPPFEVVLELLPEVGAEGGRMVLFADDLRLRLEE